MEPSVRNQVIPADGVARLLDAGWLVAFDVEAADREMAILQGRIEARSLGLRPVDVVAVGALDVERHWRVELQIEPPGKGLGL